MKRKKVMLEINKDIHDKMKSIARDHDKTLAGVYNEALDGYVKKITDEVACGATSGLNP
jgi:hypothetical protein